ncbi:MAG: TMEM165/GDT1 family protein [Candidatus Eremiobacteraeota bacterium]|nr:TMEM165/GDT1 family protein [Candidatus Eremiobacteraeota bacterium]
MNGWLLTGTTFLASVVEAVEAVTIVLAVGYTQSWRSALGGAAWAAATLAGIVGIFGPALVRFVPLHTLQLVVGLFLVLFGFTWTRKAIWRYSGRKTLHDEAALYQSEVAYLQQAAHQAKGEKVGFATSYNAVLLEGLEVAVIVITFGAARVNGILWAAAGALAACAVVCVAGFVLRKPFSTVPENTLKFVVGIMLLSFGTFWSGEGLNIRWWYGDLTLAYIVATYVLLSWVLVRVARKTDKGLADA